jgi:2-dehydro-3-deoxyphosphogluconate aldolase / (4S)-4-hydroxy-2-oxoglutarate aldolase
MYSVPKKAPALGFKQKVRTDMSMIQHPIELAGLGPVIPVIVLQRVEHAVPMARALVAGGVRVMEVTLRTPVALECMRAIAKHVPEAVVGAGTLRTTEDVAQARAAGCQFGVSPGFHPEIAAACKAQGLPLLPGVSSASDVMAANLAGHTFLKFFPASAAGGMPMLKALAGPFPDVTFCPTGGITLETAPQYLAQANVKVCGGSWLTPQEAMEAGDWAGITARAAAATALRPS